MFKTIASKIRIIIIIIVTVVLNITCIVSYQISRNMLNSDFSEKSGKISNQYTEALTIYLTMIRQNFSTVTKNPLIQRALTEKDYSFEITSILDNIIKTNAGILGITLYGINNGALYRTSSISNPPPYNVLITTHIPKSFPDSPKNMCTLIRRENIAEYYDSLEYAQKSKGIFTYITKVFDEHNNLYGYLLLDIPLNDLFKFYNHHDKFTDNMDVFIRASDNTIYPSPNNIHSLEEYTSKKAKYISKIKKYINEDTEITVYMPISALTQTLNWLLIKLIIFSVSILVLCLASTHILIKSITHPLDELKEDIKNSILVGENND